MTDAVLSATGLVKTYNDNGLQIDVLRGIDFQLARAERVAIIGPSGAGKSTLLHILGGLDSPDAGQVTIAGNDIHAVNERKRCQLRNEHYGFVYQFHHLLPEFSVLENVAMPLLIRGVSIAEAIAAAHDILAKIGLDKRTKHRLAQLSGGERQRAAIARALVTKPACLLADEPTGNLDHQTADRVFKTMLELNAMVGTSMLIVTHDLQLAAQMDLIYHLEDGLLKLYQA